MAVDLSIRRISLDRVDLEPLRKQAAQGGFRFLDRLVEDWASGAVRFDRSGEQLLGAFYDGRLVAVGALSCEPYEPAPRTGRLRRFYVSPECRRRGVATALLTRLLEGADAFDEIRLRTGSPEAAAFYERAGFAPAPLAEATIG